MNRRSVVERTLALLALIVIAAAWSWIVAWGCACWRSDPPPSSEVDSGGPWPGTPESPVKVVGTRLGITVTQTYYEEPGRRGTTQSRRVHAFGLPLRMLEYVTEAALTSGADDLKGPKELNRWRMPPSLQMNLQARRPDLPIGVNWIGFVVNTAFWFTIALPFWVTIGRLIRTLYVKWRSRRRAARGQCVQCKYPVGDLARCPECGTVAVRKPSH